MSAVQIDVFRLSKERGTASGKFTAAELPLLAGHDGQFTEGQVEWSATGTEGRKHLAGAILRIEGKLIGSCCRCGDPLTVDVHLKTSFLFTKTESEADSMPISEGGEDEVVVGSSHFDVANWVQEELLLKLPLYPAHDVCKAPELPTDEEEELEDARPNPFAVLSSLKKH